MAGWHPNTLILKPNTPTFALQELLPRLPVPDLQGTMEAYLAVLEPLVTREELAKTRVIVDEFRAKGGLGEKLHAALLDRAKMCDAKVPEGDSSNIYPHGHWLEEWWDNYAYLAGRDPLPWNTNVFGTMWDAKTFARPLERGALVVAGCVVAHQMLEAGKFQPDCIGRQGQLPMCMFQYTRLFATTRVPGDPQDNYVFNKASRHIVVIRRGLMYKLDVIDASGKNVSVADLMAQLGAIKEHADHASMSGAGSGAAAGAGSDASGEPRMCAMTSLPRSEWAATHEHMKAMPVNKASLDCVEGALFCMCLSTASPTTGAEMQQQCCHGDGSDMWQDKSFNCLVFENGVTGFNGEHSCYDAPVSSRMLHEVVFWADAQTKEVISAAPSSGLPSPDSLQLKWELDATVSTTLTKAYADAAAIIRDAIIDTMNFKVYGKTFIRDHKFGPDSYLQMALQLAFYRDQHFVPTTYESATMRTFLHGRTDTIRPGSPESVAWVKAMDDPLIPPGDKVDMLRAAAQAHTMYLQRCMLGRGIDRHLLGMRIIAMGMGGDPPALFTDPSYAKATHYILSTSQMAYDSYDYPGFGAPTPDAYGVCYVCQLPDVLLATVSSNAQEKGKDARRMRARIVQALIDMQGIILASEGSKL